MFRFCNLIIAALLLPITFACTTTTGGNSQQNQTLHDKGKDKVGGKLPDGTAATKPPESTNQTAKTPDTAVVPDTSNEPPVPSADDQMAFVKTHSSPNSTFGEAEHQFVQALPNNPPAGSVTEAVIVIGLLRTITNPRNIDTVSFKEADINQTDEGQNVEVKTLSLEQMAKDRGINLADAIVENPLLGSYGVAKQVQASLQAGGGSPDFKTEITLALKRQASLWGELSASLSAADQAQAAAVQPIDDVGAAPNPADLHGNDAVLTEAQALADRGNFQAAIRKASTITPGSPMRPMADEKIKEFSKTAVQELRSKAANAFQSAAPVTDAKTKVGYLKQAKTYLEDAIKNFPDAPQLPTVRDNLRAISRDLEKLQTEQGH